MGWKFWQREPTAAEQSLADLQAGPAVPAVPAAGTPAAETPAARTSVARTSVALPRRGSRPGLLSQARMLKTVTKLVIERPQPMTGFAQVAGLEHLAVQPLSTTFTFQVHSTSSGTAGQLVLSSAKSTGTVEPGSLVGLVLINAPHNTPGVYAQQDEQAREAALEMMEAMTHVRATSATVVSFEPAAGETQASLVITGLEAAEVPVGSLVLR